jgi:hypothetical protein
MSKLKEGEPSHWHTENGTHRMKDPRLIYERGKYVGETFDGKPVVDTPRGLWDADERAYAEHLEAHGIGVEPMPEPHLDDSELINTLFLKIENNERQNKIMREMIVAIREAEAAGKTAAYIRDLFRQAMVDRE